MELNMKALVKMAVMLFLLGITATVEARFDASSFIKEVLPITDANYFVKSTTNSGCCDQCACTRSIPAKCRCPGEACQPACSGTCFCIWNPLDGTKKCNRCANEMFFPRAVAH